MSNGRRGAVNWPSWRRRDLKALLVERDGAMCWLCGLPINMERRHGPMAASVDHVVPLKDGGLTRKDNMRLAHHKCNSERHRHEGAEAVR